VSSTWISVFAVAVAAGTTFVFASVGEILAERAGILNLGMEGMMLVGAVAGFMATNASGSLAVGVLAALLAGAAMALVHAVLTITLRANQVVSGLTLTIFGFGLSALIGQNVVGNPAKVTFDTVRIPWLSDLPFVGRVFFQHDLLVYLGYVVAVLAWFLLYRTRPGLHLRSVGESAATADAMGVGVTAYRYAAVLAGGALAGLAGAYLSIALTPGWNEGMTAGRGWIAVGLVIFARWNPLWALAGGYLFGLMESLNFQAQAVGIDISPFFLGMLPYLFTILAVVIAALGVARRLGAPADLGVPYEREEV
jgi:simple sugar transport system permease protein